MNFKYLIIESYDTIWGKHELTKEYFINAVQRGATIVNTEDNTVFSQDDNAWLPIRGDEK